MPEAYGIREKQEENGKLILKNRFYRLLNKGELRTVTVQSSKINILNMLFFPDAERILPTYAAEFVALSGRPIVAVIDSKFLHFAGKCTTLAAVMTMAQNYVSDLVQVGQELPEWFELSRSGHEIFVRPANVEAMLRIMKLHAQIWQRIGMLLADEERYDLEDSERHHNNLMNYKRQQSSKLPWKPFVETLFRGRLGKNLCE